MRFVEKHLGRHVAAVWRIEWEERQSGKYTGKLAPHFHLMLFGVEYLGWQKVREWWRRALRAGDGPLVTEVKRIYNEDGACRYLSKYVSKYRSLDISAYHNSSLKFGRHWGILRKELIPRCPVVVDRVLTDQEAQMVRDFGAMRWKDYDAAVGHGFTLLGKRYADGFAKSLNGSCNAPVDLLE